MKHLTDYLSINMPLMEDFRQLQAEIELDMVFESFKCTILKDVRNQIEALRAKAKAVKDEINKKEYKNWWEKPPMPAEPNKFNQMFMYKSIRWDTITDDQVTEYTKDNKEGIKIAKRICSNRSNSIPGIIINASKCSDDVVKYSSIIQKTAWDIRMYNLVGKNYSEGTLKPGEVESSLSDKFWIIELRDDQLSYDIQNQRRDSKSGMIKMGDPTQYTQIAKANMERYKRLAEKKRMEKDKHDGIAEKIFDYMEKIMSITEKFSKDPLKYSAYEYAIGSLLDLVGDRCHYDSRSGAIGKDGLMTLFHHYLSYKLKLADGKGSDYDKQSFEAYKQKIKETFDKIDKKLADIKLD